jgi:hypothetical protein
MTATPLCSLAFPPLAAVVAHCLQPVALAVLVQGPGRPFPAQQPTRAAQGLAGRATLAALRSTLWARTLTLAAVAAVVLRRLAQAHQAAKAARAATVFRRLLLAQLSPMLAAVAAACEARLRLVVLAARAVVVVVRRPASFAKAARLILAAAAVVVDQTQLPISLAATAALASSSSATGGERMECYCAKIENGIVSQVIVCSSHEWAAQHLGGHWVCAEGSLVGVGWIYDGQLFTPPEPEPQPSNE